MKIKDWTGTHPISGTTVVGTVVILTESNNINLTTNSTTDKNGAKNLKRFVSSFMIR